MSEGRTGDIGSCTADKEPPRVLGRAQKHLDELIVLKRANPDADSGRRQKRRLSPTPSVGSRHASPLPAISSSALAAAAGGAGARASSPLNPPQSTKRRIEALHSQLPLRPGRQVVCKEPKSVSGDSEPGWILAKVVKMIGADKMRYEVEDADEDGERKCVLGRGRRAALSVLMPALFPADATTSP